MTDPITLEVIRNRLDSVVREMANITQRTARSAVVHSGRDFSCSLFDHLGRLVSIGTSIPVHILPMVVHMSETLRHYEGDIAAGDIFIGNDPHDGGTHLNDVLIFTPVFYGETLIGYACNRAHWTDIGGSVAGSISGSAREIFQEGLRIPPMRLGRNDCPDPDILRFITLNVRMPHEVRGDLMAQLASCRVAQERIEQVVSSYGIDVFQDCIEEILDDGERRMRARINLLPDCTVSHEGYLDNDGTDDEPVRLRSTVTIHGDALNVDFTGTAPQRKGCINISAAVAEGFAFMGIKAALDPKGPVNAGCFRPIEVIAPQGSCRNANPPAACGGLAELGQAVIITMVAMSGLVPDQISAEEGASANHQNYDGVDSRTGGGRFVFYDAISCGGGARRNKDGMDFVRTIRSGNYTMMSIESLENIFPIVFERQQLRRDSGGAGRFRGGLGLERDYRVLESGVISVLGDHAFLPPAGLEGGGRGAPTRWEVVRPDGVVPVSPQFRSKGALPVRIGDVIRVSTPGGGGWGHPCDRDPERVRDDVMDDKISILHARESYGVVLDENGRIDVRSTQSLRLEIRSQRDSTTIEIGSEPVVKRGMRLAWCSPESPWRVNGVVEVLVTTRSHPLTVRIAHDGNVLPGRMRIDTEGWNDLNLSGTVSTAFTRSVSDPWP